MKKKEQVPKFDLSDKSLDELENLRLELENDIAGAADNASLAESMPGQKLIKRLTADLDAIRKKYAGIKGGAEEQLAALHRLQGREQQVNEELENLKAAVGMRRNLGLQLESVTFAIGEKKRETPGR